MTSRGAKSQPKAKLEELLGKSGLVCQRPYEESEESSVESEEWLDILESEKLSSTKAPTEEDRMEEEELATSVHAEAFYPVESTAVTPEEGGFPIFPTPSLAFYRHPRLKKIYAQNEIHVLPDEFNTDNIDASKIPRIGKHHQQYIAMLADIVGCRKYDSSLAEYWFLDTLASLLCRAQKDHLPKPTQAILVHWFCQWMQEMRNFDNADRKRMMRRFQENMRLAAQFVAQEERLPTPQDIGVTFKEQWAPPSYPRPGTGPTDRSTVSDGKHIQFDPTTFECCMRDLAYIIHYICDLFSTDYQFDLVRSIFTIRPENRLIDASFQLRLPKKGYATAKSLKQAKTPRKTTPEPKVAKNLAMLAPIKKVEDTPEFLHLMEIKATEDKELEAKLEQDREEWNRRSSILPLAMALDENFLDKYWPPPPPEAEEEPRPAVSATKKGSKKKK